MFDNNQNFNNNPKPLFENDFNNMNIESQNNASNQNYNIDFQNSFTNNYNSMNNFNVQSNIPNNFENNSTSNNIFANDFYNQSPLSGTPNINPSFENRSSQVDIPPELGEIKNLKDATVANAPTMDILGSTNAVHENSNFNNDPLEAYENGSISLPQLDDSESNFSKHTSIEPVNQNVNTDYASPNLNFNNDFFTSSSNTNDDNNSNIDESPLSSQNLKEINETANAMSSLNMLSQSDSNELEKTFNSLDNSLSTLNDDFINNVLPAENSVNLPSFLENKEEQEASVDIHTNSSLDESNDIDYTILQDKITEEKQTPSSLFDLGIEDIHDQEDSLDIMDFEEDNEEESSNSNISSEDNSFSTKNVEKIKKVIYELKKSGVDIELEEFDFEHMYQLIVKMNK